MVPVAVPTTSSSPRCRRRPRTGCGRRRRRARTRTWADRVSTRSVTSPPSRTRTTAVPRASANQIAPSASSVQPSGSTSPSSAHTPAVVQRAVVGDGERGGPPAERLADDQRAAVGRDHRAVRELEPLGADVDRAVRLRRAPSVAGCIGVAELEPEVADVGGAVGGDDHVVAPAGGHRRQVGVGHDACRRLDAQHAPRLHRHHQQAPVGQPARARSGSRRARARRSASPSSPTLDTVCWWKSENHSRPSCQRGPSPKSMTAQRRRGARTRGEPTALESPHACCRAERRPRPRGRRGRRSVARPRRARAEGHRVRHLRVRPQAAAVHARGPGDGPRVLRRDRRPSAPTPTPHGARDGTSPRSRSSAAGAAWRASPASPRTASRPTWSASAAARVGSPSTSACTSARPSASPSSIEPALGALVEPLAVGLHTVERAHIRAGDKVLVVGAGPVGLSVITWAAQSGASELVVSDPSAVRREAAAAVRRHPHRRPRGRTARGALRRGDRVRRAARA